MDIYDVAIIGAGPGGPACALEKQGFGLDYILIYMAFKDGVVPKL
jgi:thioredoxin reductase